MLNKTKQKYRTMIRIDKFTLNRLAQLKQPIKLKTGRTKESYSEVISRLIKKYRIEIDNDKIKALA